MATLYYGHPECRLHEMGPWSSERPERLDAIEDYLVSTGLMDRLERRAAPLASRADLERVHTARYIDALYARAPKRGYRALDDDTIMNPHTVQAALRAAGAAVAATDAVHAGEGRNAFCAIRPPGHHALPDGAMGFCFFNNVAVAARHALDVLGLERVAIVDFDVHHGNGTEEACAGDARILMTGFFEYPLYPYCGVEEVAANMVNVPIAPLAGAKAVRTAMERQCLPALEAHRPQMIFVSAGFDAHQDDDIGDLELDERDYVWLTQRVMEVADRHASARLVSCLEGGYHLDALRRSVAAHLSTLLSFD